MRDLLFPTRRTLLGTAATAGLGLMFAGKALAADDDFAALEKRSGGRLGVAALDKATGARLTHREGERFAMCSTFKMMAAAAVLAAVDKGELSLDKTIPYGKADLLDHVAHELVVALLTAKQRQVYDLLPNKVALIERRTGRDVYSTLLELREKGLAERKNGKWVRITEIK